MSLIESGRLGELVRNTTEMRQIYEENLELGKFEEPTAQVTNNELELARRRAHWPEFAERLTTAREVANENKWSFLAMITEAYMGTLANHEGRFDDAIHAYDEQVRLASTLLNSDWRFDPSASLLNRTALRLLLGDPVRATADIELIETMMSNNVQALALSCSSQSFIEHYGAECSSQQGHPHDALRLASVAIQRRRATERWSLIYESLPFLCELYVDLGLPGLIRAEVCDILRTVRYAEVPLVCARIQSELVHLALATGDRALMREHAKEYFALNTEASELSFVAGLLERSPLARLVHQQWSDDLQAHEYFERLDTALTDAVDEDTIDRLSLERARWHLLCKEPHAATSLATSRLPFRRKRRGPSFLAEACLVAAHGYRDLRAYEQATECVTEARTVLAQTREQARPFDSWTEVMLETARLATAQGETDAAWQAIDDALAFANQRRLKVERMRLLLEQARLELDSPRGRDAAVQSLQIASELGYLRDEGQIRLVLAQQAEQSGDLGRARSELEDARWLLNRLGPPEHLEQAEAFARRLGLTSEQPPGAER